MKKQLCTGIASLLLPLASYGATSQTGAYQRNTARSGFSTEAALPLLDQPASSPAAREGSGTIDPESLRIAQGPAVRELLIIDEAVPDQSTFYRALRPGVAVAKINTDRNGLKQLRAILADHQNLEAVHIVSHAEDGVLHLGNSRVTADSVKADMELFAALNGSVKAGGDLLFYGCNLAATEKGEELLDIIAGNTQLDVTASNDVTGNTEQRGDWELEISRGSIESNLAFSEKSLKDFSEVLAPETYNADSICTSNCASSKASHTSTDSDFVFTGSASGSSENVYANNDFRTNDGLYLSYQTATSFDTSGSLIFTASNDVYSFELASLVYSTYAGGNCTGGSVIGYVAGGGTVSQPLTWSGTGNSASLGSFNGVQITRFHVNGTGCSPSVFEGMGVASFTVDNKQSATDSDGNLTAAGGVTEPVGLATTADSIGEAVDLFDFTLSDGGTSDGQSLDVSEVRVNVSGTSTDTQRSNITWQLNGPDASNVTGSYDAGSKTITFSPLSISVADGGNETYTINAYYNDNTNITEDNTIILSVDGDTDLTIGSSGTQMGSTSSVTNGSGTTIDVTATGLAFTTQPAGSTSGSALSTQPVVSAQDAFGNIDIDFTETITLTEASAGSLSGDIDVAASGGIATFTDVTYTATADQQSFTLTADDQSGTGSDLPTVDANPVTSDVVATRLLFETQPSPTTVGSGIATDMTTVPVISAVDANNVVDTGYGTDITLAKVNGAGSATMSGTGDTDGNGATVSITPSSGTSTFTGLQLTYTASGGSNETFNLQASSGGLTTANSNLFTAVVNQPPTDIGLDSNSINQSASGSGSVIGALSTTDADSGDTHTYSIVGDGASGSGSCGATGGDDNASFQVDNTNGELEAAGALAAGSYNVCLQTSDGIATYQESFAITVADDVAPTVSSVSVPSNGTYTTGQNLDFTVSSNENITVNTSGGTPRIALTVGSTTRYASYINGSGTSALAFRYTVQADDLDTDGIAVGGLGTNGGTLQDAANNSLNTTLNSIGDTSSVLVDTVAPAPTITSTESSPSNSTSFTATVNFGETVTGFAVGDISAANASLSGFTDNGDGSFDVTVSPSAEGTVTLDIAAGAAQDAAGNNSEGADTFSLNYDGTLPALSGTSPADGATNVPYDADIQLTFEEPILAQPGSDAVVEIFDEADNRVDSVAVTSENASVNGNTATIDFVAVLVPTMSYYVQVSGTAFADSAGNLFGGINDKTTLNFTVANISPTANNDTTSVNEDQSINVTVLNNDTDPDSAFNAASVQVGAAPSNGSTSVDTGSGVITYTPNADFAGTDTFTYTVDDVYGGTSNEATVTVTVNNVNDAPTANDDTANTPEDNPISIDVAADDTDIDNGDSVDPSTILITSAPTNGSAELVSGEVLYTPETDFSGTDQFSYTIEDQNGGVSNVATVIINVNGVNDTPTAADDSASVDEDNPVEVDVTANDSDIDGSVDATTVQVLDDVANGTLSVDATTGVVTYTPDDDFNGTDSFTYVVRDDANGSSNEATVTLTVNSVNDAPVAEDNAATLQEETPHEINVLGNDSDVDGSLNTASVEVVSEPSDGSTAIDTATGAITYTPEENFDGNDSFTYRVMDNEGLWSNVATVSLTVQGVNDAPLANDDDATTEEDTPTTIDLLTNDNDVDGTLDAASIALSTPANGSVSLNGDGTVTYTPDEHFNGADSFTYTVNDNVGEPSNAATVSVTVIPINDAPTISGTPTASVNEGEMYSFTPTAADVDSDDVLSFSIEGQPDWAEFDTATGALTGTPGVTDSGNYPAIVISVTDGNATTSLPTFSIDVMKANNAPVIGGVAPNQATVGQAYTFAPTANDPDESDTLTYSATGLPEWLTLDNATGELSGTPADDDVGNYTGLQVSVSDGTATDTLDAFSLTVEPGVDSDSDSFSNYQEGLDGTDPNDPASYLDLMPPQLAAPADQVLDADALFTRVTLRQLLGLANDATDAELQTALNPLASDDIDGSACCNPRVVGMEGNTLRLAPGRHEITWLAEDRQNNSAEATQVVNIRPLVSLSKDQVAVPGNTVELSIILNGESPFYPLTIPYRVADESTAASDAHDLTDGSVVLEEGELRKTLTVTLAPDEGGSNGALIVALDDRTSNADDLAEGYDESDPNIYDINSGAKTRHRIEIVAGNVAPRAQLQLVQNEERRLLIPRAGGPVTVTARVTDPNTGDSHQYDWSTSDSALVDTDEDVDNNTLIFEPDALNPGRYRVSATVTDSAGANTEVSRHFVVVPVPPTLNPSEDSDNDGVDDATEGFSDDNGNGIPNYQDSLASTNVLPESVEQQDAFLMECDPGVACGLGEFSLQTGKGGAQLGEESIGDSGPIPKDTPFEPVGGVFDFEMAELPELGQSVSVVIPQRNAIPASAVYRKYLGGEWVTFVEDAENRLQSAEGEPGYCPPVGASEWEEGLNEGHHCVQLTIQDGGPNDADGRINGSVADPGAVSRPVEQEPQQPGNGTPEYDGEVTTRSSGGGGTGALLAGLLLSLGLGRRWVARRARGRRRASAWLPMMALGSLLLPSPEVSAQAPVFEQLHFEVGLYRAKSSTGAAEFTHGMNDSGAPITLSRYDIDRQALSFEVGLPLAPHFLLGFGYLNLGDVAADFQVEGATAQALSQGLKRHYPYSTTGWTVSSQLRIPLAERIAVTADVGLYRWESETRSLGPNLPAQSLDGLDPMLGVGFELPVNERVTAGFHLRQIMLKDQSVDLMGLSLSWQY